MSWASPFFVLGVIGISTLGWVLTTWVRARHGYPIEGEWGSTIGKDTPRTERTLELLAAENGRLTDRIMRLEERIAVLERIATDRGARLSDEIGGLR